MTILEDAGIDIGHPAPHRDQIPNALLALGLVLAPLAWIAQLLILYGFAGNACWPPGLAPAGAPAWTAWALPLANVVGLVAAALAIALSYRNLRRSRREHEHQEGGMVDAGEGRTRFLALWGLWAGGVFLVAIAFNTIAVFWAGLCAV
jgi:hypothetical protein